MKIMYLTDQFYLHGGIEKMLSLKINHWISDFRYDVILCTSQHGGNPFVYDLDSRCRHIDLGIDYNRNQSYFHPKNIKKSILHFNALRKLIRKEKPDVVISVNYTPEQFFLPFIEKQIPKIKEFHSSGVNVNFSNGFGGKMKRRLFMLFEKYSAQVVLNEDEKKYYPFSHLHVIPNFVEEDQTANSVLREKTIIAAGRIAAVKQFDHLIKGWALIANNFPDWNVKIFGGGDNLLEAQLNALIQNENIINVSLCGQTSHLKDELRKASIYAMTSSTECFPMVLLEAQNAGLPIVSYDCPNGPRNIMTHNIHGWLTPPNEIAIFASTLAQAMTDESARLRIETAARENVKRFSANTVMRKWDQLIKSKITCLT